MTGILPTLTYTATSDAVAEDFFELYGTSDPSYLALYADLAQDEFIHDRPMADWRRELRPALAAEGLL